MQDPNRKFMLQLAIAWGQPIEYIESLPMETLAEFKALNAWAPYTPEAALHQNAVIASMLSHKVYKKGMSPTELFPFTSLDVPNFLEDEMLAHARNLIRSTMDAPSQIRGAQLATIHNAIQEEIDMEKAKDDPDDYLLREYGKLLKKGAENGN
ncbi:hypothetical protein VCHA38O209_50279 [Vibrio chagasii]|nr:hypothetical protein VCHA38O209_50279 [Vibrio chagasii]